MSKYSILLFGGSAAAIAATVYYIWRCKYTRKDELKDSKHTFAYESLIGNTPMIQLKAASQLTGCRILVKMESMNPGGTGKDRAALSMLNQAEQEKKLKRGGIVTEGTSGSTGISLACLCKSRGYQLKIVMPDDQAAEKKALLERLGAEVTVVPTCAISNSAHYVHTARKLAESVGGFFVNQFENVANFNAHFTTTGPEIFEQAGGVVDAFVMSSGTGGTIAGVSKYLYLIPFDASIITLNGFLCYV